MSKDPAFLFYPNDWMGGTMILSRHHKGCYMDLLVAQFNNGPLSLEAIRTILGQDQATWTVLQSKFKKDSTGNFYNERLAAEIEKRRAFSEKQRVNGGLGGRPRLKKENPSLSSGLTQTEPFLENGNRNEDGIVEEGVGETEFIPKTGTLVGDMRQAWTAKNPGYFFDDHDNENLLELAEKIKKLLRISGPVVDGQNSNRIKDHWFKIVSHCKADAHLQRYSIGQVNKHFSSVTQSMNAHGTVKQLNGKGSSKHGGSKSAGANELLGNLKEDLLSG